MRAWPIISARTRTCITEASSASRVLSCWMHMHVYSGQVSASFPKDASRLSEVKVVLRNAGSSPVDLLNGTLRIVVTKWETTY